MKSSSNRGDDKLSEATSNCNVDLYANLWMGKFSLYRGFRVNSQISYFIFPQLQALKTHRLYFPVSKICFSER